MSESGRTTRTNSTTSITSVNDSTRFDSDEEITLLLKLLP